MSLPVYYLLNLGWSYLLARHGSEQVKREVLPHVAKGEWFLGICTTEPGGGSDLASAFTTVPPLGPDYSALDAGCQSAKAVDRRPRPVLFSAQHWGPCLIRRIP